MQAAKNILHHLTCMKMADIGISIAVYAVCAESSAKLQCLPAGRKTQSRAHCLCSHAELGISSVAYTDLLASTQTIPSAIVRDCRLHGTEQSTFPLW